MRALFSDRERPFYGQARPLALRALPPHEAARDIEALLRADGLDGGRTVDELLAFTTGHPQRTVLLAHHLYNVLDSSEQADAPAASALDLAMAETNDAHQAVWDGVGRVERIVLAALPTVKPRPAAAWPQSTGSLPRPCKTRLRERYGSCWSP